MKNLKLFILVCLITGVFIFLGSILGAGVHKKTGVFVGAGIGGIVGLWIAVKVATYFKLVGKTRFVRVYLFSLVGLGIAIFISLKNLHTPVIPLLSTSLIGLGGIIGNFSKES